jgi:DNA-binding PadR family transcriptional regulator
MPSVPGLMILGLLAERDWTAYELVKQLTTRSIANVVWNLSERTLYREPAKLVAEGLATAVEAGGRPTTYSITDQGRTVLENARHQRNEFVHQNEILATLYAVAGESTDALLARLLDLREEFRRGITANGQAYRVVAATPPSMPNRALMSALLARLHTHMLLETERWITGAIAAVREVGDDDRGAFALAEWARIADSIDAAVATWDRE